MENCNSNNCRCGKKAIAPDKNLKQHTIEIVADFVCPWCYIGQVRLSKAISEVSSDLTILTDWQPFQLNRNIPAEGMDRMEQRIQKFGTLEKSLELDEKVRNASQYDGIEFRHDLIQYTPNTLKAHRLTWLFNQENQGIKITGLIFKAYFHDGKDIGNTDVLADLASRAGMSKERALEFLNSNEGDKEVKMLEHKVRQRGVEYIPLVVIGQEIISASQPTEMYANAINRLIAS